MGSRTKLIVLKEVKRVGYYGSYCLIVPDHAAGRRNRFTVYRIPASPSRRVKVIGRELSLGYAQLVASGL